MSDLSDDIEQMLRSAAQPLSVDAIATALELDPQMVYRRIWQEPLRYAWQPGNRWALASEKQGPAEHSLELAASADSALAREPGEILGGKTVGEGIEFCVSHQALDTKAVFTVRSLGNRINLVLNSSHEIFDEAPLPFDDSVHSEVGYRRLLEVLLIAWTLYADGENQVDKRKVEEINYLWGRRVSEVLDSGIKHD